VANFLETPHWSVVQLVQSIHLKPCQAIKFKEKNSKKSPMVLASALHGDDGKEAKEKVLRPKKNVE
jgi:hypothetical protein